MKKYFSLALIALCVLTTAPHQAHALSKNIVPTRKVSPEIKAVAAHLKQCAKRAERLTNRRERVLAFLDCHQAASEELAALRKER